MGESSIAKASLACFVAFVMVIGFTAAPVAAADDSISVDGEDGVSIGVGGDSGVSVGVDDDDGVTVDTPTDDTELPVGTDVPVSSDGDTTDSVPDTPGSTAGDGVSSPVEYRSVPLDQAPVDACRDVTGEVQDGVPFEDVPWFGDLPEEAQPSQVPTNLVTPRAVAAIVFGAAPNQCEVQDPNDPSVDPTDPPTEPGFDYDVAWLDQHRGGVVGLVYYEATMNESGEGPGVSGSVGGLLNPQDQDASTEVTVNDGEKDYSVSPDVHSSDDGTGSNSVGFGTPFGNFGGHVDCDGAECQPGTSGLPEFVAPPAVPAPTSQESDDGGDDSDETFPSEFCTDVGDQVLENVPFEDVPWFGDLPEEAQPSQVPTNIVTPRAVAAIVFGAAPNQCEVQDPNDPSVDPTDPPTEPGFDYDVAWLDQHRGGVVGLVYYEATMNESGEGPGVSGSVGGLLNPQDQDAITEVTVNDGEKDYSVSPDVHSSDDGTGSGSTEFGTPFGNFGGNVKCDSGGCQPGTSGLPKLVEAPHIPPES